MTSRALVLVPLLASFALAGCIAPSDSETGDEATDEATDALHDASAMAQNGAPNTYRNLGAPGTTVGALGTPTGTIGYGNAFVTDEWVVEIDMTYGHGLTPVVQYSGAALDAVTCSAAHLLGTVYGYAPAALDIHKHIVPAHWDQIADVTVTGTWLTVFGGQGFCSFGAPGGLGLALPHIAVSGQYSLVRVGGAADRFGWRQNVFVGAKAD